jgi:LmbE family N-acetylglucosaminyl deacetylase
MNPYRELVAHHSKWFREGKALPLGSDARVNPTRFSTSGPTVLIFSPHPDDECIVGGLPIRLQRECGWRVVNVAVTQGSRRDRQEERLVELRAACGFLDFGLETIGDRGLEKVSVSVRHSDPEGWRLKVSAIEGVLRRHLPRAILFPHANDWNATHVGVHHLVMDALQGLGKGLSTTLVETEFWGQNYCPNLLIEIGEEVLTDMITALTFHVGEVRRNPYHLTLPAWMINSVRLGGETVGGQGMAPPDFPFGTVYRVRRWADGIVQEAFSGGRVLRGDESPDSFLV